MEGSTVIVSAIVGTCALVATFAAGCATGYYYLLASEMKGQVASPLATTTPNKDYVAPSVTPTVSVDVMRKTVMSLVNEERVKAGLKPLVENSVLNKSAELKAKDMAAKGYWSHSSPSGDSPWDFFDQAGYKYTLAGENLARDYVTPQGVVNGWMNSELHRKNILAPGYVETGIAVIYNQASVHQVLVVQHYGAPTLDLFGTGTR